MNTLLLLLYESIPVFWKIRILRGFERKRKLVYTPPMDPNKEGLVSRN
jgi:hypothetical protein